MTTRLSACAAALLLALTGCDALSGLKAQSCTDSSGCPSGQTCDVGTGRCEAGCGGVAVCANNQNCVNAVCIAVDKVDITTPVAGAVVGLQPLSVSATAASGAANSVDFKLTQGNASATKSATTNNNGVFTALLPIKGDAAVTGTFVGGSANLVATLHYTSNGTAQTKDSAPISVTIDADAPAVTAPTTDRPFFSTVATPAQTAHVTVQVNDVGPAGVDSATVSLAVPGHTYPPASSPASGAGAYTFSVPAADLNQAAGAQGAVGYVVNATDKVGNASAYDGGSIAVDNKPPVFTNFVASTSTYYGADAGVPLQIDITDPAGGAGLDATSVQVQVVGGTAASAPPTGVSGATRTFAPLGGTLQLPGTQGPVSVQFVAKDNVGNAGTSNPASVLVDLKAPTIGAVTITPNPAANTNGWYKRDASGNTTVTATVSVDDGTGGSGAAAATLSSGAFTSTQTTGANGSGTARTYTIALPTSVGAAGQESAVFPAVTVRDAVGNTATATSTVALQVDDLGPVISNVTVATTADFTATDGTKYFNQLVATDIEVDATVVDNGSGVSAAGLKLMNGSTQVDRPGTATWANGTAKFFILRSGGPVAAGASGTIAFNVVAADTLGNASTFTPPATVKLAVDAQAPSVTNPGTDKAFYSSAIASPPTATVTVTLADVGPSGLDASTVKVSVNGHTYNPATTPAGGSGAYTFSVPVADLGQAPGFQGPVTYTVTAKDNAKNPVSFTGGSITLDNKPPTFANFAATGATASGFYGPASTIGLSVDVTDPTGGAGLDAATVKLGVVGGPTPAIAATGTGPTFSFAPLATDLLAAGTQGTVTLKYVASDKVGNAGSDVTQTVKIDLQPPTLGTVTIPANPAANSNGWYKRDASGNTTVNATVVVDDGAGGSGAASAALSSGAFTGTQTTGTGSGTAKTFTVAFPTSVGTAGQESTVFPKVTIKDAAGNTFSATSTASLQVDDKGPAISNAVIASTADFTAADGTKYFNQLVSSDIEVDVTVVDNGSGVATSTLKLMSGATQVDRPGTATWSNGTAKFFILRSGGPVAAGASGSITFDVIAGDNLANGSTFTPPASFKLAVDAQAPSVTNPSTDKAFYSSIIASPPNAVVTVTVADVGPSGLDSSTVRLTVPGHNYPPATIPAGGTGAYTFAVPVTDLGQGAGFQGPVSVTVVATDNAKNPVSFTGGSISLDNKPPTFSNYQQSGATGGFYGPASTIGLSVDIADPAGGSGLDAATIKLGVVGGATPAIPATGTGPTFSFAPIATDLLAAGTQGTVTLKYVASDKVANQGVDTTQTMKIDLQPPAVTAISVPQNTLGGSNGFYKRDGTPVTITVTADDGAGGSGIKSAAITAPAAAAGSSSSGVPATGTAQDFTLNVTTNLGTAGQVSSVSFTATGTDVVGNTSPSATSTSTLKIDDQAPQFTSIALNASSTPQGTAGGTSWFGQSGADIEVDAVVTDGTGSGVKSVTLTATGAGTGNGAVVFTGVATGKANEFKFLIPRDGGSGTLTGPVGTGKQSTLAFSLTAIDNVGNSTGAVASTTVTPSFAVGIDGQAPVVSLDLTGQYPGSGGSSNKCDTAAGGLGAGTSITCGHDGNRFWRNGDDGSVVYFTVSDGASGSGSASAGGTCSLTGQGTCTVTYNTGNAHYEFALKPSQASDFISDANGNGTSTIQVSAKDVAGNSANSGPVTVNITRFKWARTLPIGAIKASPIVTPVIGTDRLVMVGGDASGGTVSLAALNTNGGVLSTVPTATLGSVTTNPAYSAATKTLYATKEGASKLVALTASATGLATAYTCDLGGANAINGSPTFINTNGLEYAVVGESSGHVLWAFTGTSSCDFGKSKTVQVGTGTVRSPATDGAFIYVSYQDTGIAKVPVVNATTVFGSPVLKDLAFLSPLGGPALVGTTQYMADAKNYQAFTTDFTGAVSGLWGTPTTNGHMTAAITSSPVVSGGFLVGAAGQNDGFVRVFNTNDGSPAFSYSTGKANSQVAIGGDAAPVYYFTDGNAQLNAIVRNGASATLAPRWSAPYTGAVGGVPFTGITSEPTLASDGTLYFGADNGTVYAIATDSPGGAVPGVTNWPRVGFDNCNSNNTSLSNCQ